MKILQVLGILQSSTCEMNKYVFHFKILIQQTLLFKLMFTILLAYSAFFFFKSTSVSLIDTVTMNFFKHVFHRFSFYNFLPEICIPRYTCITHTLYIIHYSLYIAQTIPMQLNLYLIKSVKLCYSV